MAAITPQNGRVAFVTAWDPHTYWELNSTNLGTNYGDDPTGNDDNTAVSSGDISTSGGYQGMNNQNDDGANGWLDIYVNTDAAMLLYIPAGLAHGTVYGLWSNGGGTNAQGGFLRATTTGVEIALAHNAGSLNLDCLIEEIPDADLPGWFALGFQFSSEGGSQGDMGLWINGTKVRNATRSYQLLYGSGDPDFGNNTGREPKAASVRDPSSYLGGDWGNNTAINSSGILIANFAVDNPGPTNSSPAGNGDTWYTDYYDEHVVTAGVDELEGSSDGTSTVTGALTNLARTTVVKLALTGSLDPASSENHKISIRHKGTSAGSATVKLLEGTTTRATKALTVGTSWATETYTLNATEANSITDYANLFLTVEENPLSTDGWLQVSWLNLTINSTVTYKELESDTDGTSTVVGDLERVLQLEGDSDGLSTVTSALSNESAQEQSILLHFAAMIGA